MDITRISLDTIIIGHSQTKYFTQHLPESSSNVSVISRSGYRIDQIWTEIEQEDLTKYSCIVLVLGANDLPVHTPPQILRNYQVLVENIWSKNKSADIFLSSILPRADNRFKDCRKKQTMEFIQKVNTDAMFVNNRLREICMRTDKLHFIGHPCFVQKGLIQRNLLSKDGLHLSFSGTETLIRNIIQKVESFHNDLKSSKELDVNSAS